MSRFSLEDLYNPHNRYYPVYSWMWNEALSADEIKRQLDEMYDRNIRGVYVIPLPKEFRPETMVTNLQPPYLSDGYFEMFKLAADYASSKGMTFWLYDEGGWPSGNANGLVTADDSLKLTQIKKGFVKRSSKADLTNVRATEKFISLTHEKYHEKMGESFKNLGPLVFTDEPSIGELPFTEAIKKEYKKRTGKRLSARKLAKHKDARLNIIYHDICADVFAENYFAPIKKWCNSRGLLSAGHLDKDNEAYGFSKSFHHPLRQLRLLDVPGIDVIWGQIMPGKDAGFFPRLASSAAEQSGSGLSLTESLSVYGTMTYEQMRYILGYQLVRGINVLNFMLMMYDEKGYYALRQRPAFSDKLPGGEYLAEFNRYMASLQYLMQGGKPDNETALYLPVRSLWAGDDDTASALENYEKMGINIERNHGQFDIIDDDLILAADEDKLQKGILSMGRGEYSIVYIPADEYMPDKVKHRLDVFRNGGGKIYYKNNAEYLQKLHISGDSGWLRVHKRKYDNCEIYLVFNESAEKINAEITLPDMAKEIDVLNKKVYSARRSYSFESGEIKTFIVSDDSFNKESLPQYDEKICSLTEFKIKRLKKFSLTKEGMSCTDMNDSEKETLCGDWSALYGEEFSGKCQYKAKFDYCGEAQNLILSLGKVCYGCQVTFNRVKIADLYMPPYETVIDKSLIREENEIILTVENTASNAFVHFDAPREWEKKHIGPYHEKALEFEKKLLSGGLLGPVEIYKMK